MADEVTKTETVEVKQPASEKPGVALFDGEPFDAERAKSLIEKLRGEVKELKPLASKAQDLLTAEQARKEAELSEMEKLQKQLADAQAKADALARENAQRKAADDAGLPAAFADRIKGETPEDMLADAKSLLEAMPKQPATPKITPTNPGAGAGKAGETDEERRKRLFG